MKSSMIASLGGQPQVVTFALDALLAQGEPVANVFIIHPSLARPRLAQSHRRLAQEFAGGCYRDGSGRAHACRLHRVPLLLHDTPLADIRTEAETDATWQIVRDLLADLKNQGHALHLCLAGGRRMIALLATSAAALLCDHRDRVWHLYTPGNLQQRAKGGAILHAAQMGWLAQSEPQCQQLYERLTERQRDTLRAFARGLSPQDVAEELGVTLSTVNAHKTVILGECRVAWGVEAGKRLDYRFLRERFGRFVGRG